MATSRPRTLPGSPSSLVSMARFDKAQDVLAWAYNLAALVCILAAATWVVGVVFMGWSFGVGNYGNGAWFG